MGNATSAKKGPTLKALLLMLRSTWARVEKIVIDREKHLGIATLLGFFPTISKASFHPEGLLPPVREQGGEASSPACSNAAKAFSQQQGEDKCPVLGAIDPVRPSRELEKGSPQCCQEGGLHQVSATEEECRKEEAWADFSKQRAAQSLRRAGAGEAAVDVPAATAPPPHERAQGRRGLPASYVPQVAAEVGTGNLKSWRDPGSNWACALDRPPPSQARGGDSRLAPAKIQAFPGQFKVWESQAASLVPLRGERPQGAPQGGR